MTDPQLEEMVAALEATGDFRVLRRLQSDGATAKAPAGTLRAVFLDVETTGIDPNTNEIIELAMVPFYYTDAGEIVGIGEPFEGLREPSRPIPPEITRLTGINDAMVAGKHIEPADVAEFAGRSLLVAHNAAFDRRFMEDFCPTLQQNPWACSMSEIAWIHEGFESRKLAFLALSCGLFYDRHRALNDCYAAIELLARDLPRTGNRALAALLASARRTTIRCWAENSPFESKEVLKLRGYRWNGEDIGQPRAWWVDVDQSEIEAEKKFLCEEIYQRGTAFRTAEITAFNRYSNRIAPSS